MSFQLALVSLQVVETNSVHLSFMLYALLDRNQALIRGYRQQKISQEHYSIQLMQQSNVGISLNLSTLALSLAPFSVAILVCTIRCLKAWARQSAVS